MENQIDDSSSMEANTNKSVIIDHLIQLWKEDKSRSQFFIQNPSRKSSIPRLDNEIFARIITTLGLTPSDFLAYDKGSWGYRVYAAKQAEEKFRRILETQNPNVKITVP